MVNVYRIQGSIDEDNELGRTEEKDGHHEDGLEGEVHITIHGEP